MIKNDNKIDKISLEKENKTDKTKFRAIHVQGL